MGYTHNWYRPQIIAPATFQALTKDFQEILPALEAAGSPIANARRREAAELSSETIQFNGVENCGHAHNPAVRLPGPTPQLLARLARAEAKETTIILAWPIVRDWAHNPSRSAWRMLHV